MPKTMFHQTLSAPGLLRVVRDEFDRIKDPVASGDLGLTDCLMSALAMFSLKHSSLLSFERGARDENLIRSNLRNLYGVVRAPSDTAMRERLDQVDPRAIRGVFKKVFAALQRGQGLEGFTWLDHHLLSVAGIGHFSSKRVHCEHCCEKHHRDGSTTWYHQMLGAVLVHPEHREVFPLAPEPILRTDGSKKNDCERHAAKLLLRDVRREHPHLKLLVVEDALASNGPHIRLLQELDLRYVLGVKPGDHGKLFHQVNTAAATRTVEMERDGSRFRFRFLNGVPLNETNFDLEVNFLECWETRADGRTLHFSWVTDLEVMAANADELMRAGRTRWRIENETFNTLKNQGDGFEHNFGHGRRHLATVFAHLTMLAFLIDQVQQRCCALFQATRAEAGGSRALWERLLRLFLGFRIRDWETLYQALTFGHRKPDLMPFDTS